MDNLVNNNGQKTIKLSNSSDLNVIPKQPRVSTAMTQKQYQDTNQQNYTLNHNDINNNSGNSNNNKYLDAYLKEEDATILKNTFIIPLKLISKKNKTAKYHCTVCNYYCHSIEVAFKHKSNKLHLTNSKVRDN